VSPDNNVLPLSAENYSYDSSTHQLTIDTSQVVLGMGTTRSC